MIGFEFVVPAPDGKPVAVGFAVDPAALDGLIESFARMKQDIDSGL